MLSQMQRLSVEADGRYATDDELRFVADHLKTHALRVKTYQRLQELETTLIQQVCDRMKVQDPSLFQRGNVDVSVNCKRDILRTLRYTAAAMLIDDTDTMQERFLFWFQSIMRSFGNQKVCNLTYAVMQDVVKQIMTPQEASLLLPILEMNRRLLGSV